MITAREARQLYESSEQALKEALVPLEKKIRETAIRGERQTYFFDTDAGAGHSGFSHGKWPRIKAALAANGFRLQIGTIKTGGGLGSMDDEPGEADVLYVMW